MSSSLLRETKTGGVERAREKPLRELNRGHHRPQRTRGVKLTQTVRPCIEMQSSCAPQHRRSRNRRWSPPHRGNASQHTSTPQRSLQTFTMDVAADAKKALPRDAEREKELRGELQKPPRHFLEPTLLFHERPRHRIQKSQRTLRRVDLKPALRRPHRIRELLNVREHFDHPAPHRISTRCEVCEAFRPAPSLAKPLANPQRLRTKLHRVCSLELEAVVGGRTRCGRW